MRIIAVNWASLGDGELKLRRGRLGEVIAQDDGSFRAELRGLAQPLQQTVGAIYQAECRADLGDARCKVDLAFGAGWTQQAIVEAVTDSVTLVMSAAIAGFAVSYFEGGVAIWRPVPMPASRARCWPGTRGASAVALRAATLSAGGRRCAADSARCDKRKATCQAVFGNYLNFRGEPFIPGALAVLETPG